MSVRTIIGILGLGLMALGCLWYWQLIRIAASFAGTASPVVTNLHETEKLAIGLASVGFALVLLWFVLLLLATDENN